MFHQQLTRSVMRASRSALRPSAVRFISTSVQQPTSRLNLVLVGSATASLVLALSLKPDLFALPILSADSPSIYLDPTTKTPFPSTRISPGGTTLKLVGTGVRTVSFLSIKVYAVGFYVDERSMKEIAEGKLVGWKGYTEDRLLPPFPKQLQERELAGEALIGSLLDDKRDFALVITPLRNTSLPHLRDGFSRAIVARLKQPQVATTLSEEENEQITPSLSELKSYLPNRPLAAGSPLVVNFDGIVRSLRFSVTGADGNEEVLGIVKNKVLARELFCSYFADSGASSEEMRRSAAKGFAGEVR